MLSSLWQDTVSKFIFDGKSRCISWWQYVWHVINYVIVHEKCLSSILIWVYHIVCCHFSILVCVCLWEMQLLSSSSSAFRRVLSLKTIYCLQQKCFLTASPFVTQNKRICSQGLRLNESKAFCSFIKDICYKCRWHLTCVCKTALKSSWPLSQVWSCSLVMLSRWCPRCSLLLLPFLCVCQHTVQKANDDLVLPGKSFCIMNWFHTLENPQTVLELSGKMMEVPYVSPSL